MRADERRLLWCQACGLQRRTDPLRWALHPTSLLWCPVCSAQTEHHAAHPRDVAAERCLCGACRTRRAFEEAGAEAPVGGKGARCELVFSV